VLKTTKEPKRQGWWAISDLWCFPTIHKSTWHQKLAEDMCHTSYLNCVAGLKLSIDPFHLLMDVLAVVYLSQHHKMIHPLPFSQLPLQWFALPRSHYHFPLMSLHVYLIWAYSSALTVEPTIVDISVLALSIASRCTLCCHIQWRGLLTTAFYLIRQ